MFRTCISEFVPSFSVITQALSLSSGLGGGSGRSSTFNCLWNENRFRFSSGAVYAKKVIQANNCFPPKKFDFQLHYSYTPYSIHIGSTTDLQYPENGYA